MMNFEDLNNTTQLRLRNNGIKNADDLINQLLDRIVELEEMCDKDSQMFHWRGIKNEHERVGVEASVQGQIK